jgi:hypothetical protein
MSKNHNHNIASLTCEPGDGITVRVKLTNGGELVATGEEALPVFYALINLTLGDDDEEMETVH